MRIAVCPLCGGFWSVLLDGTLAEHSEANCPALLCPGSRSKANGESCARPPKFANSAQAEGRAPARRPEPRRADRSRGRHR
jgi:hypothetical protein